MFYRCICTYGHSRSVALCRVLHDGGVKAVACGYATGGDALNILCEAADKICILDSYMKDKVWEGHHHKLVDFAVGPDRWSNPYNQELLGILGKKAFELLGHQSGYYKP